MKKAKKTDYIGICILSATGAITTTFYFLLPELLKIHYLIIAAVMTILSGVLIFKGKTNV